jgi:hypothetical protein
MRRKSKFRYLTVHLCMQAFHRSRYCGSQLSTAVYTENLDPAVMVMKSTQNRV